MTKKVPPPPPPAPKKKPATPTAATYIPKKSLTVERWDGSKSGEKVLIYGASGIGKTTLAALSPNAVFIGFDDGGRKIKHPHTGEWLNHIAGVETFQDYRDALHSYKLLENYDCIVTDSATKLQEVCEPYIFKTRRKTEENAVVDNLEAYGWGKGYKHLVDCFRMILQDSDLLTSRGKNIILLAQESTTEYKNAEGADYMMIGPDFQHNKQHSVRNEVISWSDHVARVKYYSVNVKAKKAVGDTTRVVQIAPDIHFYSKSRTLDLEQYGVVSFESKQDDSFWKILLGSQDDEN